MAAAAPMAVAALVAVVGLVGAMGTAVVEGSVACSEAATAEEVVYTGAVREATQAAGLAGLVAALSAGSEEELGRV